MPERVPPARRVLMIGSEAAPFAKTGGLADVMRALPIALAARGWNVTVALPRYRGISSGRLVERFPVAVGAVTADLGFYSAPIAPGATALFVDCPELFDRESLYAVDGHDYPDNPLRFAMLVRGALEFCARAPARPSIVHAHDWQAGLAPVYLRTLYASHPVLAGTPTVFTIHNLAYQGLFDPEWLPRVDLPWNLFSVDRLEFWGRVSYLKGGINDADVITTVSPRYADEIQTPELGFGFDGILRARAADLFGILNGIDTVQWNPSADPFLPAAYDAEHLDGKALVKRELLSRSGFTVDQAMLDRPIVGMISRMVDQKGFDLLATLGDDLTAHDATWIVLGTGEARYQRLWTDLAARHPGRIAVRIGFDEGLAHLIEGGADVFLMPSRFEPCGLNQMYSLRYGTVPVVHGVGGLLDTVRDYAPADARSTGFVFRDYTPTVLTAALDRALAVFKDKRRWRALQVAGMRQDNSWDRSAREYVKIYERVLRARAIGSRA